MAAAASPSAAASPRTGDDAGHAPLPIAISKSNFEVTFVRFISSGQGRDSEGERKEGRKEKREEGEEEEEGRKKY